MNSDVGMDLDNVEKNQEKGKRNFFVLYWCNMLPKAKETLNYIVKKSDLMTTKYKLHKFNQ